MVQLAGGHPSALDEVFPGIECVYVERELCLKP